MKLLSFGKFQRVTERLELATQERLELATHLCYWLVGLDKLGDLRHQRIQFLPALAPEAQPCVGHELIPRCNMQIFHLRAAEGGLAVVCSDATQGQQHTSKSQGLSTAMSMSLLSTPLSNRWPSTRMSA